MSDTPEPEDAVSKFQRFAIVVVIIQFILIAVFVIRSILDDTPTPRPSIEVFADSLVDTSFDRLGVFGHGNSITWKSGSNKHPDRTHLNDVSFLISTPKDDRHAILCVRHTPTSNFDYVIMNKSYVGYRLPSHGFDSTMEDFGAYITENYPKFDVTALCRRAASVSG